MILQLITQPYNVCSITYRFLTKSLTIINMAAILDLKIFTNVINNYLNYQYATGYFQNAYLSTLSKTI